MLSSIRGWPNDHPRASRWIVLVLLAGLVASGETKAELLGCGPRTADVSEALERIRASIDPCGESVEILDLLEQVERCAERRYRVCVDTQAGRNVFDRPADEKNLEVRTVTWNPELRTHLEDGCDGDPTRAVERDPTASLLHELAHAAQDCAGLNPAEHELEAVRIENIYRRAAGICQRTGYGMKPLPAGSVRLCTSRPCSCVTPPYRGVVDGAQTKNNNGRLHGDRPE
jgi:hypothetical protein